MACILEDGRLTLSGYVGDVYFDDGFTYAEVLTALATVEDDAELTVHVNSGGGIATEGSAIHALLAGRAGRTDVVIDGIAASAASIIAMAGETVTMSLGSVMMIHDPAGITFGTAADHERHRLALEALATTYSRVYAAKSGKTPDACREIMKAETWMTPETAVAEGFADATTQASAEPVAAFDYRVYAHAPKELRATAQANDWRFRASAPAAQPAAPTSPKETPMADKTPAGDKTADIDTARKDAADAAVKADRKRRAAIMALPEAKGRESLADHLYASTEMSAEQIKATLAAAPEAKAEGKPDTDPAAYEASRIAGTGLGGQPPKAKGDRAALSAAVTTTNKRR